MKTGNHTTTNKNLDRLASFLQNETKQPFLAAQIPDKAHIYHGAYDDDELTQANLKMAANTLLGMALGYVEDAPLVIIYEYEPGQKTLVNLSSQSHKRKASALIQSFREQSWQELNLAISASSDKFNLQD